MICTVARPVLKRWCFAVHAPCLWDRTELSVIASSSLSSCCTYQSGSNPLSTAEGYRTASKMWMLFRDLVQSTFKSMDQALKISGSQTESEFWKKQKGFSSKSPRLSVFTSRYQITLAPIRFSHFNHLKINAVREYLTLFIHLLARFPGAPGPVTSRNVRINGLNFSEDARKTTSTVSDRTQRQAKLASSCLRGVASDLGTLLSPARQCSRWAKPCVNECKFQCVIARHVLIVPVSLTGKLRQGFRAGYTWPWKQRVAAAQHAHF